MQRFFELDKNSFSRYLGRNICMLIELTHSEFEDPYYLVNNTKAVTIDGKTYNPFPFDLILPSQTEQQGTQVVFSNVNNYLAKQISEIVYSNENVQLQLYIANVETSDVEKINKGLFEITEVVVSPESVTATINIRNCLNINVGTKRYNKQNFPNLYL